MLECLYKIKREVLWRWPHSINRPIPANNQFRYSNTRPRTCDYMKLWSNTHNIYVRHWEAQSPGAAIYKVQPPAIFMNNITSFDPMLDTYVYVYTE
jgi:hypothetical protein